METFINLIFLGAFGFAYYFYMLAPKKRIKEKITERESQGTFIVEKPNKMKELDFYGTNKLQENPEKFLQAIEQKKIKMENGEEIAVDAMEAFYLIRNSRHHDLIVSEDGKVNFKKIQTEEEIEELKNRIMNFEREGDSKKIFQTPGYVERVEDLQNGGVRWVFTKEHAAWCGIESTCYDKYNRVMPDPDRIIVEDNKKNKSSNAQNDRMDRIEKKLDRNNEFITEQKFQEDLKNNLPKDTKEVEENIISKEVAKKDVPVKKSQRVKSDADILEDQNPIPSFEAAMEVQENLFENINYENIDSLVLFFMQNRYFIDAVFEKSFSSNSTGSVFLDFSKRCALIEKNYFMRTLKTFLKKEQHTKYDFDFFSKTAIEIFDGRTVDEFIKNIDSGNKFESFWSKEGNRFLFNFLLMSTEVEEVYFTGWFLKVGFENIGCLEEFIEKYARGSMVETVDEKPKDIERRIKKIKNIKITY